ncbi:MAG: hypothetical protein KF712_03250 [Akkermansiaceae bacterium]|nr:hypothetical protein [Akkermansiaceae bacterium]
MSFTLNDIINSLPHRPSAGGGIHPWLYRSACLLHRRGGPAGRLSNEEIHLVLRVAVAGCGRPVPEKEIRDAVHNSSPDEMAKRQVAGGSPRISKWPLRDPLLQAKAIAESAIRQMVDLAKASPEPCQPPLAASAIIGTLFDDNPLICAGDDTRACNTMPRLCWGTKLDDLPLIVPSAMSAPLGKPQGKDYWSPRTLENTGPRLYLVTEFDQGTFDEQAALIWHLTTWAPLVMVVHSGGKSLHAWWYCRGVPEEKLRAFMHYAVSLGADPITWTRCQLVRMPGGLRDGSLRQRVLYFNPGAGREEA